MKHIVTGGSGFLGSLIAKRLFERKEPVTIVDLIDDASRPNGIQFVKGDILDRATMQEVMRDVDVVHHTAALVPITKSGDRFAQINVEGSRTVAEAAAGAKVKTLIYMSSSAVYGTPPCPVTDNTVPQPKESYGKSKLEGEKAIKAVAQATGLKIICFRPKTLIGGGRMGIFQLLFDWIKSKANLYVIGTGHNKIQFLHPNDLLDAYFSLMDQGASGFFNVGTDRYGSVREALEHLCAHASSPSKVISLPTGPTIATLSALDRLGLSPLGPWHYLTLGEDFYFDVTPMQKLGWQPKYSNDEMLAEAYDAFIRMDAAGQLGTNGSVHRKPMKQGILRLLKLLSQIR